MYYIFEILTGLVAILLVIYYFLTSTFNFFRDRGIPGPKPEFFFGTFKDVFLNKTFVSDYLKEVYQHYKNEPIFGVFSGRHPIVIVKDAEKIKNVLIKDFSSFSDRGVAVVESVDILNQNLFFLPSERWRPLRINLSPVFTSGKLKEMFYLIIKCSEKFEEFLHTLTAKNSVIQFSEVAAKFTTDVIGMCAFGLNMNSLTEEENQFRKYGKRSFDTSVMQTLKVKIRNNMPWLYELLGRWMRDDERNNFFIRIVVDTMKYRKENNIKKNDMIDMLMEIRDNPNKLENIEMTDTLITAQAFVFFVAGFETSASTISNALYELALNQSIQNKLREEVLQEFQNNNGSLTFTSIKNMKYMNKVYFETLRKYPVVPNIMRKSVKEYTFSETNVMIPKGTMVWIPVYAIHRDPDIYSDPDTFDPERFDDDNVKQRHSSHFLPFGDGPRNCIGLRFANYQVKIGIAVVLKTYKVDVCDETSIPLVNHPRAPLILTPKDGITLKFTRIH